MKKNIVCYYHNDPDGIVSAGIVKKHYDKTYDIIKFIKCDYGQDIELLLKKDGYDKCIIVDFSFEEDNMKKLYNSYEKDFLWIDHHISAKEKLKNFIANISNECVVMNLNHSGCFLTWAHFMHGQAPYVVKYVQDVDLWKWEHVKTDSFISGFCHFIETPDDNRLYKLLNGNKESEYELYKVGNILIEEKFNIVNKAINNGIEILFKGYKTLCINSQLHGSFIGNAVCKNGYDIGMIWAVKKRKVIIQLRSIGDIDVSKIAEYFGGGGHKNASGFTLPDLSDFVEMIYKTD